MKKSLIVFLIITYGFLIAIGLILWLTGVVV